LIKKIFLAFLLINFSFLSISFLSANEKVEKKEQKTNRKNTKKDDNLEIENMVEINL